MKSKISMSCAEWGIFLLRVVLGLIFITQGWVKLHNIPMVSGFFSSIGLGIFWVYLVSWTELLAGIAVLLGVFTRIAGYLLSIIIIVAIYLVKFKMGFLQGYSSDLLILASALTIAWSSPGPLSVARTMCGCGTCTLCGGDFMKKNSICDNCDSCKEGCNEHEVKK